MKKFKINKTPVYKCNELVISKLLKITKMKLKFYFNKLKKWNSSINKKEQCNICLNNISSFDKKTTSCNHTFCESCLEIWTKKKNNCPICRNNFSESILDKEYENSINFYRTSLSQLNAEDIEMITDTLTLFTAILNEMNQ